MFYSYMLCGCVSKSVAQNPVVPFLKPHILLQRQTLQISNQQTRKQKQTKRTKHRKKQFWDAPISLSLSLSLSFSLNDSMMNFQT